MSKKTPSARYTLSIVADSGYESTMEGWCTPGQYGEAVSALHGMPVVAWGVFESGKLHDMFFTREEADEMARLKGTHAAVKPLKVGEHP